MKRLIHSFSAMTLMAGIAIISFTPAQATVTAASSQRLM